MLIVCDLALWQVGSPGRCLCQAGVRRGDARPQGPAGEIAMPGLTRPIARGAGPHGTRLPALAASSRPGGRPWGWRAVPAPQALPPEPPRRGERMSSQQTAEHGEDVSRLCVVRLRHSAPRQLLFTALLSST